MVEKTGYFLRVEREGKWLSLDVAELTNDELVAIFAGHPETYDRARLASWVVTLAGWIRDHLDDEHPPECSSKGDFKCTDPTCPWAVWHRKRYGSDEDHLPVSGAV